MGKRDGRHGWPEKLGQMESPKTWPGRIAREDGQRTEPRFDLYPFWVRGSFKDMPEKYAPTQAFCHGDVDTWDAGHGGCSTYAPGEVNNYKNDQKYCDSDEFDGVTASEACPQCGQCQATVPQPYFME